jgi:hypothetical protein
MFHTSELWRPKHKRLYSTLALTNSGFAFAVVFVWTVTSLFIAEPIAWATWSIVEHDGRMSLLRYPLNMLWMLPLVSLCAGWLAKRAHKERLALGLMTLPVLLFGLTILMYHVLGIYGVR